MTPNATIKKLPKSLIEITGSIPVDVFDSYRAQAIKKLGASIEIDGFRKGAIPEKLVVAKVGEMLVLEEMAQMAIGKHYVELLQEHKIDAIGRPEVNITKIAAGNPLEFKITTTTLPEITLPDYKKIGKESAKEKKEVSVGDAELEATILQLRKMRAHQKKHDDGTPHDHEKHDEEIKEEDLPPLDDAFAQSVGNFKTVEELKEKIRENLKLEKEGKEKDRVRLVIVDKIIAETKCELPDLLIDHEVDKMLYRLEGDISSMGMKLDDYLAKIKKSKDDLKKEWRGDAEKHAIMELVVSKISETENLKPTDKEVKDEVVKVMEQYKNADEQHVRAYVAQVLTNQKVFKFLETGGETVS